jgi:hypothetical protein
MHHLSSRRFSALAKMLCQIFYKNNSFLIPASLNPTANTLNQMHNMAEFEMISSSPEAKTLAQNPADAEAEATHLLLAVDEI